MKMAPSPDHGTVRFATDLCIYHEGAVMDMEYVTEDDVWYRMEDLKCMKLNALTESRDRDSIRLGSLISNTYGRSNNDTIKAMNAWVASCDSLRGLERFANSDFGEKRMNARRRTIHVVLTAQHKMRTNGDKENRDVEMTLSRLSEAFSQDYTRFAAIIGQADMLFVSQLDNTSICCVNESDIADSQKIIPKQIFIHDMVLTTKNGNIRSKKGSSVANGSLPPAFCHRTKKTPSSAQRDFTEMRFCF